jgi:hypothetical protein
VKFIDGNALKSLIKQRTMEKRSFRERVLELITLLYEKNMERLSKGKFPTTLVKVHIEYLF